MTQAPLRIGWRLALCLVTAVAPAHGGDDAEDPYRTLDQVARVLARVQSAYVVPVDQERLVTGAIRGLVRELDPHSEYLPSREFSQFQQDTRGEFAGIGVEVDFRNGGVVILAPIEGTPAFRAGLKPGDRIVAIDGASVAEVAPGEVVRRMRGKPGTSVRLTVTRAPVTESLVFTLVREVIRIPSIAARRLARGIAYLRIKQFQTGTHGELLQALAELRRDGPLEGFLIDLRYNPGGLVDEASAIADELLMGGEIYSLRHRGRVVDRVRATPGGVLRRGAVVALVNEYTASAAELLAGALQDHHRAVVVGARTFGKGSVQTILELPHGDGLKLTTMRYYTAAGRALQAQGVVPSIQVEGRYDPHPPAGILRERDLERHLPAEGKTSLSPSAAPPSNPDPTPPPQPEASLPPVSELPEDPTGGADLVLSLGYQLLVGLYPLPR